jgi:hypothetical protein
VQFAGARVVGAHDAPLYFDAAIVAHRRADDDEIADHRGR